MIRRSPNTFRRPSSVLGKMEWRYIAMALDLTDREIEVGQWVFDGAREPEIGAVLGISMHTVHSHIRRIYEKTDTRNRAEFLVRVFVTHLEGLGHADGQTKRMTGVRGR